jgi:programmed cell death 6-interacting protein
MTSNLLFIPYRKTQNIEFGAALRDIISKEYYQTPSAFEGDLQEVDTLRKDIVDLGATPHDLALLKRYFIHVCVLETKFPKDLVEFPWFGTLGYRATGPVKLRSFTFEKLNLLYNIGALYTQIGCDQDRSNAEGLKKACLYFQYAATHFNLINKMAQEDISITLPLDMQTGTIETLRSICLAQAQEVFWQKAISDKVKDSLIARLAIQVQAYYDEALRNANRSEGFRSEWISHMTVKKLHFEAAADYRASLTAVADSKYGEEVAYLRKAQRAISSASSNLKFVSQSVKHDFEGLSKTIRETLKTAEKDNDLIYVQDVPASAPQIQKAPVTKELPIEELTKPFEALKTGNYGKPLFHDLLPFDVIQISQAFRERQIQYVEKHVITPVRSLTKILHKFQFERDLPASVDSVDKPLALPASILEHHQDVKRKGGVRKLKDALNDIMALSQDGEGLINGAKDRLRLEAEEDGILRQRQGSKHWTRPKSEVAAANLLKRVTDLENYLKQANAGDQTIKEQFEKMEGLLSILGSSEEKIRDYIPDSKARQLDPSLKRIVTELKENLSKARKLELEREHFIEIVELKNEQYNIFPKIVSEYKAIQSNFKNLKVDFASFDHVFTKHIKNFESDLNFIEKQKKIQQELEDKIDGLNKKFKHLNTSQGSNGEREKAIKGLDAVYSEFTDLLDNLSQGLNFYNDFNSRCHELIQDIDKFVYERRIEARDLEDELNTKFQQMKLQSSPLPSEIHRPQSPAMVAPKAKPVRGKPSGLWNPENGIRFG